MKLLLISQFWEPENGPAPWRLARFVDAWIGQGHHATVITPPPHHPKGTLSSKEAEHASHAVDRRKPNLIVRRTSFREHDQRLTSRMLDQLIVAVSSLQLGMFKLDGMRPDVVVAAVPAIPTMFTAALIATHHKAPLVIDLRDAWPDLLQSSTRWSDPVSSRRRYTSIQLISAAAEKVLYPAMMQLYRHAALVITTSDHLRASLEDRGVVPVTTIRNATDIAVTGLGAARKTSAQRPLRILYAGTVGRAQGLSNAVRALARARQAGAAVELRILGEGAELESVRATARELDVSVDFQPPVPKSQVHAHYQWCDASLIHLRDWDALQLTIPSKLIELMAIGVPVCVAANGESADIVLSTSAGAAVPAMDPGALANLWIHWAEHGVPEPSNELIRRWLHDHADPSQTSQLFVEKLEQVVEASSCRKSSQHFSPLVQLGGIAGYAAAVAAEDPIRLATLVSRRLPTSVRKITTALGATLAGSSELRALAYFIGDRRDDAAREVRDAGNGRVANAIRWRTQTSGVLPVEQPASRSARQLWALGHLSEALAASPRFSPRTQRWQSTATVLATDFDPAHRARDSAASMLETAVQIAVSTPKTSNSPRVLHVITNSLPHTQSGYSLRTHSLLTELHRRNVDIAAVTRSGYPSVIGVPASQSVDAVDEINYLRIGRRGVPIRHDRRLQRAYLELLELTQLFQPDVIHTTTDHENGIITRAVAQATGIPWVYETRGEPELTWLSQFSGQAMEEARSSEYFRAVRELETQLMRDANAVVALSKTQQVAHETRGIDGSKILVVPNSVPDSLLSQPLQEAVHARARLGLIESFTVGTVSSLVDYEGLDVLIKAISLARDMGVPVRGLLVGDGAAGPHLQSLVTKLKLDKHVDLIGKVPHTQTIQWYDAIDLFCIPRLDTDVTRVVTPLKGKIAAARSRPILVSELPALVECTGNGCAGPIVPPGDHHALANAIRTLAADHDARNSFGLAARRGSQTETWDTSTVHLIELYEKLAGKVRLD